MDGEGLLVVLLRGIEGTGMNGADRYTRGLPHASSMLYRDDLENNKHVY